MDLENVETKTNDRKGVSKSVVAMLMIAMLAVGFFVGNKVEITSGQISINKGGPDLSADYGLLWDALDLINEKYVDRPVDQEKLLYGAVSGLINALSDPYTVFLDPQQSKDFEDQLKGTFDGIGAEIGMKNEIITVIAPLDGTPAQKAGILPGDSILAINGESTGSMTVDQAAAKIRGKAGTEVALTILHEGSRSPSELKIIRSHIVVKSVSYEAKDVSGGKVGVIKIKQFGDDTKELFDKAVLQALSDSDKGLIIDLRNDPGGYLDTAIAIASNWVSEGQPVVTEVNYLGEEKDYKAEGVNRLAGIKTVVLVNDGSASASEIVAGALQDYKLATLIGEKTFGKGSVQELNSLKGDSTVKITIAKWLTPNGRTIDRVGLEPDIKIVNTPDDINNKRDPQMDKALEQFK